MKQQHDDKARRPWRAWYSTPEWHAIRARQLRTEPNCRMCAEGSLRTPATTVDHIVRHRGDRRLFFGGPFQSLCKRCHDSTKQQAERLGYSTKIGLDGFPSDANHPFNK